MVRKRIYSDLYPEMLSHNADIHIGAYSSHSRSHFYLAIANTSTDYATDHCIESLRELIMCGGNMTPIPLEWSETGERLNPNYASTHTCRDFSRLKEWTVGRSKSEI